VSRSGSRVFTETPWAVDLLNPTSVQDVIRTVRPTHLLHLAWDVIPGRFWHTPANLDWVAASLHLTRTFAENGGQRLVIAGTCAEYDWSSCDRFLNEQTTPLRPGTLYGVAKDALRRVVERYCTDNSVSWAWGRIFNPYGPGEPQEKLIASVVASVSAGHPARCTAGTQERDYLHAADVGRAFAALTLSAVTGCVNIASGVATTVSHVATRIGELAGRPDLIRLGEKATSTVEAPRVVADVRRLTEQVGWRPTFTLDAGLTDTLRAAGLTVA
jgi:nucleoside-diphosphate-sugar epimerase